MRARGRRPRWNLITTTRFVAAALGPALLVAGCDGATEEPSPETTPPSAEATPALDDLDALPDVIDAAATYDAAAGAWSFAVTMSSPYDTPERYADGWRVLGPDGTVYGTHTLLHDHAAEQPFTRTQTGVEVPDDVAEVTIEGRDLVNGFGGSTVTITLDRT